VKHFCAWIDIKNRLNSDEELSKMILNTEGQKHIVGIYAKVTSNYSISTKNKKQSAFLKMKC